MADETFIQTQLNSLHIQGAATQQAVTDIGARFDKLATFMEKFNDKVELKADKTDVKEVIDDLDDVKSKQNWIMGIGTAITFVIGTVFTYLGFHPFHPGN